MHPKWFTLVEMLIVVIVVGIIMSMTMNMWRQYFNDLEYRQDKESFVWLMDEFLTIARTSSYNMWQRFEALDISFTGTSLSWSVTDSILDAFGAWREIDTYTLQKSMLVFPSDPLQVRLYPYAIWCDIIQGGTWFTLVWTITDDITCFEIFSDVCKIKQITCP